MSALSRLYRGETRIDFIGSRRRWYLASLILIVICILSISLRGFNVGIDFKGGTQFQVKAVNSDFTTKSVTAAMDKTGHPAENAAQEVGSGATRQIVVKTKVLTLAEQSDVQNKLASALGISSSDIKNVISVDSVSSSWGSEITKKAVEGLIVFLFVVFAYITVRFEWKMATAAVAALLHDLIIAAGIYSIVGFELTPSTIVGLLTILGFSLYDTVVVFDKVNENSRDLLQTGRETYASAANRAVNQTLMRSINTSLISLLPVAGLLFIGAFLLGVGTIKDLALILFVGLAVGAYSSLFLATPVVVDLKNREPRYQALAKRVRARQAAPRVGEPVLAGTNAAAPARRGDPMPAPRPGARPSSRPAKRRP